MNPINFVRGNKLLIRKVYIIFAFLLAAGLLTAAAAVAADPTPTATAAPTTDTTVRGIELLTQLEKRYLETNTYFGEFNQLKVSTLLLEEIPSKGRFWYEKPGKFRCEYLPPNEQVNLIVKDTAWVYIPQIKQVEVYHFRAEDSPIKKLNHMLLGFGVSVKDVLEVYDVRWIPEEEKLDVFALLFKPKKKEEGLSFQAITIWVKKDSLTPKRLVFLEDGEDTTEITLNSVEFNKKIKESIFKPDFPRDAEVIERN